MWDRGDFRPPVVLTTQLTWPTGLGFRGNHVYVADGGGSITALHLACPFQTPQLLFSGQGDVYAADLAVDDRYVFWIHANAWGEGAVMRALRSGRDEIVLVSGQEEPAGIAADPFAVYWTSRKSGLVGVVPKTGGPPRVLASGLVSPKRIAVDRTHVFWMDHGGAGDAYHNGRLMRLPK